LHLGKGRYRRKRRNKNKKKSDENSLLHKILFKNNIPFGIEIALKKEI